MKLWAVPLAAALAAGLTAGTAAWTWQGLRIATVRAEAQRDQAQQRAELLAAHAQALEAARAVEQTHQARITEATHEHQRTIARVRADGRAARTELERLRDALAAGPAPSGLPGAADAACRVDPDPARELLLECATQYLELAQQADGHAADVQLLRDGWPQ